MSLTLLASLFCTLTVFRFAEPGKADLPLDLNMNKPEVRIVLRVSKEVVRDLTNRTVSRDSPVDRCLLGARVRGQAQTSGKCTVKFAASGTESAFVLQFKGQTLTTTVASIGPVHIHGRGQMHFTVRRRILFDGIKYHSEATTVDADLVDATDWIETPPGLRGSVIRAIALPQIRQKQPIARQIVLRDGRAMLSQAFDEEANRLIVKLNRVSPFQETIRTLFPETRGWQYYLSTTPADLVIGAGLKNSRVPILPSSNQSRAPIELWLHGQPENQPLLDALHTWNQANDLLDKYLPGRPAEPAAGKSKLKTVVVGDWLVIQLGNLQKGESALQEGH